ncbi:MAG: hypothetical protein RIQ33_853 [Bacteroidota bacterium]|jgi:hypothetical protein
MRLGKLTVKQILQLNHLNNYLIQKQNEIIEKQKFYSTLRNKLFDEEKFTNDYEVELEVSYFVDESIIPVPYSDGFLWKDKSHNLKFELHLWYDKTPKEGDELRLEQPCCYLLHCLLYHSGINLKWILKIERVWIDITFHDQSIMNINLKNGKLTSASSIVNFDLE